MLNTVARVFLAARVGQSLAHLSSGGNVAVNVRFALFLTQVVCLTLFTLTILRAG